MPSTRNEMTQTLLAESSYSGLEKSHADKSSRCSMQRSSKGSCYGVLGNGNVVFPPFHFLKRLSCYGRSTSSQLWFSDQSRKDPLCLHSASNPQRPNWLPFPLEMAAVHVGHAAASPYSLWAMLNRLPGSWEASFLHLKPQAPAAPLHTGSFIWNQHCPLRPVLTSAWSGMPPLRVTGSGVTHAAVTWSGSWEMPGSIWRCPGIFTFVFTVILGWVTALINMFGNTETQPWPGEGFSHLFF